MKAQELQKKNDQELIKLLAEKQQALKDFRFNVAGSKSRNVKEGEASRKEIAKIMTILRSRQLASK